MNIDIDNFKKFNGKPVDDLSSYVKNKVEDFDNSNYKVVVGTDSQVYRDYTLYAVAVCLYDIGNGCHVIYSKEKVYNQKERISDRLWGEVVRTVDVADYLRCEIAKINIFTHFDVNNNSKFKSSQIYDAATGYAEGAGFEWRGKPESWAATCAADRLC